MRIEFKEVFEQEKRFVQARRKHKIPEEIDNAKSEPEALIGLAISGGGIRSATFGLGVLEALNEKKLLKKVDYLSTVSGGGYIGAWLSANCHRNKDWLKGKTGEEGETGETVEQELEEKEKKTDEGMQWRDSIAYLRRYSNYLSPKMGLLSADTWSMVTVWLRNTLLIQIMIFLSIACLLLGMKELVELFDWASQHNSYSIYIPILPLFLASVGIIYCLNSLNNNNSNSLPERLIGQGAIQWIVIFLMLGTFLLTIWFWVQISCDGYIEGAIRKSFWFWEHISCDAYIDGAERKSFGDIIFLAGKENIELFAWIFLSSFSYIYCSIVNRKFPTKIISGMLIGIGTTAVSLLLIAAILSVVADWKLDGSNYAKFLAFAFMPPAILGTFSFGIVLQIGMLGRASTDYFREWWSRFGAWLAIYGFTWMVVIFFIFLGPWIIDKFNPEDIWHFVAVHTTWIGTTLAGLYAGKSADTNGTSNKGGAKLKEIIAKIAPVVFISGLFALISVILHLIIGTYSNGVSCYDFNCLILFGSLEETAIALVICALGVAVFAWRVDINEFSLNAFYRHRLTRCFLGASRHQEDRKPHPFTGFDAKDDIKLAELLDQKEVPRGPLHIINCALNLGGSSDLSLHTRRSSIFTLTPLSSGSSYSIKNQNISKIETIGYMETNRYGGEEAQPTLGQSISVSGAAASPNSGYHTSAPVAFLMTLFNARLGWWFPNPSKSACRNPSPLFSFRYILSELFGCANEKSNFLAVSDGGHFENLAAYELIKRKCKVIIISDGECDPQLQLEGLATLIRMCKVDGLAEIDIDARAIRPPNNLGWSRDRWAVGKIKYLKDNIDGPDTGYLIYLKASMNGCENTSILQYKAIHPDFPHETTGDQFYAEDQFECYRSLGKEITKGLLDKVKDGDKFVKIAEELYEINTPQFVDQAQFIQHADQLVDIWKQLGTDKNLESLADELRSLESVPNRAVFYMCSEMIQLMENVYLDLNLEETWNHKDNEGWKRLFENWAKNPQINEVWKKTQETYGKRFISFWDRHLMEEIS